MQKLKNFIRAFNKKYGYLEISTPLLAKREVWETSGHWEHFKDDMFILNMDDREAALKPMNCPSHIVVFKNRTRSYRELPLRLADFGVLHRNELKGVIGGLTRVRKFQQDDAHIFVTEDQIEEEYERIFEIVERFYSIFNLSYKFRLGTRPEAFMGDIETWKKAENSLRRILDTKFGHGKYLVAEGDGAFYGPKIDILMTDALGREWQMGTIQLDFQIPKKFNLKYVDSSGEEKTPVVIHRVIYGSLERFIGILLEHTNGALPTWLSPVQVRVVTLTDRNVDMARKIHENMLAHGIRSELDMKNNTVDYKIRDAEMQKVPYVLVIGDKEEANNTVAVRAHGKKPQFGIKFDDFLVQIRHEIHEKK